MAKRFQNRIAESRFSLTVALIVCLPVWVWSGMDLAGTAERLATGNISIEPDTAIGLAGILLSTYLMVELNNTNALLRIYSRMVSCSFLVMMTSMTFLYRNIGTIVTVLCAIFFLYAIFHTYQQRHATGWVYYAFLALSADSILCAKLLLFVPLLWILMGTRLLSMSIKTLCASILGLLTPYIFMACAMVCGVISYHQVPLCQQLTSIKDALSHLIDQSAPFESYLTLFFPDAFGWCDMDIHKVITAAFILTCALIGTIHYMRTRQQDRIKTQLLYEMIIIVNTVAIILLAAQPHLYDYLIGIITVNSSPLIAHFIALTHTKWTNILTKALIVMAIALTAFNLWIPSLSF